MNISAELDVHVRMMIAKDMPDVLQIEQQSWNEPWAEDEMRGYLRQRNVTPTVAEWGDRVVGFTVTEAFKSRIEIRDLAVHEDFRDRGVGSRMLDSVKERLSKRRPELRAYARESNLNGQLFLKKNNFRGVSVERWHYGAEDAYLMRYMIR